MAAAKFVFAIVNCALTWAAADVAEVDAVCAAVDEVWALANATFACAAVYAAADAAK